MRSESTSVFPVWGWFLILGTVAFFALGIGFTAGAANTRASAEASLGEMVNVVVAAEAIPAGSPVGTRAVVLRTFPRGVVPPDPAVFHAIGDVTGRVALAPILPNEIVRAERIAGAAP